MSTTWIAFFIVDRRRSILSPIRRTPANRFRKQTPRRVRPSSGRIPSLEKSRSRALPERCVATVFAREQQRYSYTVLIDLSAGSGHRPQGTPHAVLTNRYTCIGSSIRRVVYLVVCARFPLIDQLTPYTSNAVARARKRLLRTVPGGPEIAIFPKREFGRKKDGLGEAFVSENGSPASCESAIIWIGDGRQ